jgi:hypothetical protein
MQKGKSLQELAHTVTMMQDSKRDYIVDPSLIAVFPTEKNLNMSFNDDIYGIGTVAHEQIATKLDIPKKYYDRMKDQMPPLLAHNINAWMQKEQGRKMVRTLDNTARAFLSDRYRPLDNYEILETVLPLVGQYSDLQVLSSEVTERRMYLQVAFPRYTGEVKAGDVVQQGLTISNSEVGLGSVMIEPFLYILKCLNGAIMQSSLRKYHVGRAYSNEDMGYFQIDTLTTDNKAFMLKVRDTVNHSLDMVAFKKLLETAEISARRVIINKDLTAVVTEVTKRFTLSKMEGDSVLFNLVNGGDLSQWGMSNAITALANDHEDYDRCVELQRIGGKVIELDSSQWAAVAH